jgi:hypothetical protein
MKAILSAKFKLAVLILLVSVVMFSVPVWSQTASRDIPPANAQLAAIEKKLAESELREKQILENQTKILDDLQKLRVLVRRS